MRSQDCMLQIRVMTLTGTTTVLILTFEQVCEMVQWAYLNRKSNANRLDEMEERG